MAETGFFDVPTYQQRLGASPANFDRQLKYLSNLYENTPVEAMINSSPATNAIRNYLPEWAGGYSQEFKDFISEARKNDPALRRYTVEPNKYPVDNKYIRGVQETSDATFGRKLGSATGTLTADIAQDGARNIWWFLNAPQALTQIAVLQAISMGNNQANLEQINAQRKKDGVKELDKLPFNLKSSALRRKGIRLAATLPAVAGMSLAIGNTHRKEGYKAVLPSKSDPTQSENQGFELLSRYFLGRTGRLLPYNEFVKERPDVSKKEYMDYKRYLFDNKSPIKATMKGIEGPEVTFLGKSIPLSTGILPLGLGVAGAFRGSRAAATRLKPQKVKQQKYQTQLAEAREAMEAEGTKTAKRKFEKLSDAYQRRSESLELQTLKSVLANTGVGVGGGLAVGSLLESMRRSDKGQQQNQ